MTTNVCLACPFLPLSLCLFLCVLINSSASTVKRDAIDKRLNSNRFLSLRKKIFLLLLHHRIECWNFYSYKKEKENREGLYFTVESSDKRKRERERRKRELALVISFFSFLHRKPHGMLRIYKPYRIM